MEPHLQHLRHSVKSSQRRQILLRLHFETLAVLVRYTRPFSRFLLSHAQSFPEMLQIIDQDPLDSPRFFHEEDYSGAYLYRTLSVRYAFLVIC